MCIGRAEISENRLLNKSTDTVARPGLCSRSGIMPKKKANVRRAGGVADISKKETVFIDGPLAADFLVLMSPL